MNSKTLAPSRALPAALGAAAILTLSACNDPGEPSPPPTPAPEQDPAPTTASHPAATTAPPDLEVSTTRPPETRTQTISASPSSTTPNDVRSTSSPVDPQGAASEKTIESASTFGRAYIETVGASMHDPTSVDLTDFPYIDSCDLCASWSTQHEEWLTSGTRTDQDAFEVGDVEGDLDEVGALLRLEATQPDLIMLDSAGNNVGTIDRASGTLYMDLVWEDGGWIIERLQFGEGQ